MNTDDILVFHRMLRLGKPARSKDIAMGLAHHRGPIYGMQPLGVPTVKASLAALARAGLVERPTKTTYAATWGTFAPTEIRPVLQTLAPGAARPALPLLDPVLRERRLFMGASVETFFDGFLYLGAASAAVVRIDGPHVGDLVQRGDGWAIRSTVPMLHLAHLHATKGYSAYRGAENALQMAVRKLGAAWTLTITEGVNPKCPVCQSHMEGYGTQTCKPCNRTMNFRRDEARAYCVGHVEAPVDITLIDPSAQQPLSLWSVTERMATLCALAQGGK
jgi:hypothetical protein